MATYAELYSRCQRRLGRKNFNFATDFLDEMKAAQEKLEKGPTYPKWMRTTSNTTTTTAGSTTVTVPADFLRPFDDMGLAYLDVDGNQKRAVRLDTREQLIQKRNDADLTSSGTIYYWLDYNGGTWLCEIAPTQTRDVDFFWIYYASEDVLTGSNENGWCSNEGELMLGMAGLEIALWLRDDRAAQYFQNLAATERSRMIRQIEADAWSDTDLAMGDPD